MIAKSLRYIIGLAFLALLTGCETIGGWLEDDAYEAPPAELVEFTPEFEPKVVWSTDTGGADNEYSDLAAWLQGDNIFAVDYEGDVSSYNAKTGSRNWQVDLDIPVATGVGGGEGLIVVGSQRGDVVALNELTGEQLWQQTLSSEVLAPPKVAMAVVVVRTIDGKLTGLSIEDGRELWAYQRTVPLLSLRGASAPMIVDDKVLVGYANGKLIALSIIDGKVVWEKSVAVPRGRTELDRIVDVDAEPVIKDDIVYAVAYHGQLAAFDIDSGEKLWSRDMSSSTGLDVAVGETIYISDDSGYVWALQDGTGDALWRQTQLLRRKITAPTIVGDYIIVGDFEGYVHWIAREDGRFVARRSVAGQAIRSKAIVKDDLVYITATDGELTAIRIP